MNQVLLTTIGGIAVLASVLAAGLWFWASMLEVPDNIDTFIAALQRIGHINAWAAFAAGIAATCAAFIWLASH
jgi:hypothetical protein